MARTRTYILHIPHDELNSIIQNVQHEQPGAVELFSRTLHADIALFCSNMLTDCNAVEDITSYTIHRALQNIGTINTAFELDAYLKRIAYQKCYKYMLSQNQKKREVPENYDLITTLQNMKFIPAMPDNDIRAIEPMVHNIINMLPMKQKNALELRMKGYKISQIADFYNLPYGTVKSQLLYAKYKIKREIAEYFAENR